MMQYMPSTSSIVRRCVSHSRVSGHPHPHARHGLGISRIEADDNPQADDELENPVLAGFEWDKEESWTRLIVHCKKEGAPPPTKKSKKKTKEEGEA